MAHEPPSIKFEGKEYIRKIYRIRIDGEPTEYGVYERDGTVLSRSIVDLILAQMRERTAAE